MPLTFCARKVASDSQVLCKCDQPLKIFCWKWPQNSEPDSQKHFGNPQRSSLNVLCSGDLWRQLTHYAHTTNGALRNTPVQRKYPIHSCREMLREAVNWIPAQRWPILSLTTKHRAIRWQIFCCPIKSANWQYGKIIMQCSTKCLINKNVQKLEVGWTNYGHRATGGPLNIFCDLRIHQFLKLGVNYPPGVICDSSGGNAEPKPQCCSVL